VVAVIVDDGFSAGNHRINKHCINIQTVLLLVVTFELPKLLPQSFVCKTTSDPKKGWELQQ